MIPAQVTFVPDGLYRLEGDVTILTGMLVLGRRGAEQMAQAWPGSHSPTGELMNALPKVVFSRTLRHLEWSNARVSDRPVEEEIRGLKAQPGKDIVIFGGASCARSLAAHGLIDEYRINVQPIALGDGLRCFTASMSHCGSSSSQAPHGPTGQSPRPTCRAEGRAQKGHAHDTCYLRHVDVAGRIRDRTQRQPREPVR